MNNNSLDVSVLRGRFFHKEIMSTDNDDEITKVVLLQSFRAMGSRQHLEWSTRPKNIVMFPPNRVWAKK